MNKIEQQLLQLAKKIKIIATKIEKLPQSGSSRQYFRLFAENETIIGVFNEDIKENCAFFSFTNFFLTQNINVPNILSICDTKQFYLLQDLGDETLYSFLTKKNNDEVDNYYEKVLQQLPLIQLAGKKGIDFSVCYPRAAFDKQSMHWDLNYFKYYFLKLANIPFDEQQLENDFQKFIDYLCEADDEYFLYRDFQSRNIMLFNNQPFFIDYQGGRRGALQYDIASLLYDAKANLTEEKRENYLQFYLNELEKQFDFSRAEFCKYYHGFVLIRILQALGTYGFRGYYEKKSHFLLSIPFAINNLKNLLPKIKERIELPVLTHLLQQIIESDLIKTTVIPENQLTISITSFSYKKGIPQDFSANGGGFVFDCRALPNPGRYEEYKNATGKDAVVIEYLDKYQEVNLFYELTSKLITQSVDNYIDRSFSHLMVNFGCTGGQHRSVYFAEKLAKLLKEKYPQVNVLLKHREQS